MNIEEKINHIKLGIGKYKGMNSALRFWIKEQADPIKKEDILKHIDKLESFYFEGYEDVK